MIKITNSDSNYLAQMLVLKDSAKHPNADSLLIWNINGLEIITNLEYKPGDRCIYFPIECVINKTLLSKLNMFSSKELNSNPEIKGYISDSCRVKAVKLRGIVSDGILLKFENVMSALNSNSEFVENQKFDTIDDLLICEKYVPTQFVVSTTKNRKTAKPKVEISKDFKFHYSTPKIVDNLWKFNDDDEIVITDKWHGTSAVYANLLTKLPVNWFKSLLIKLRLSNHKYDYLKTYSSRSVVKYIESLKFNPGSYYSVDVWGKHFSEVKHVLSDGITLYGEIVGYQDNNKLIQKGYDYGLNPGQSKFLVYRITQTFLGKTVEFSWDQIKTFCEETGLEHVKELYVGTVGDFRKGEEFIERLKHVYLEKDCTHCRNKVPAEGVCVRLESDVDKKAYKLKSKKFLLKESEVLDSGEEVLE